MSAVITSFDTLSYSKDLEKVGFTAEQAALLAKTQLYALDHAIASRDLATKKDLIEMKVELKEEIANLRNEFKEDMANLRNELKGDMAKYIEKSHAEATNTFRWTLGFMIALATIMVTLFLAK